MLVFGCVCVFVCIHTKYLKWTGKIYTELKIVVVPLWGGVK